VQRPGAGAPGTTNIDWPRVARELDEVGWSRLPGLLTHGECARLVRLYDRDAPFRSTVDMERYRFGRGQYRYFAYPLPRVVARLRSALYAGLAPIANGWMAELRSAVRYPPSLDEFLDACHAAKQTRPTALLLRYGAGDYNCLHQDLYGPLVFPLQVAVGLSRPGSDFAGGEMILHEQRPRAQSRATAVVGAQGEGIVFTNRERPQRGRRGFHRVQMRHGASTVTRGRRYVLGIIFHDAR
jgi:hypothetical protein